MIDSSFDPQTFIQTMSNLSTDIVIQTARQIQAFTDAFAFLLPAATGTPTHRRGYRRNHPQRRRHSSSHSR